MTNKDKKELRQLVKEGFSFKEMRGIMNCSDATIRNYIKVFTPKSNRGIK
jgi:hypothetical protein